jgi:hypothetical protein
MHTEIRILTKRENKRGHCETKLTIDWSGVTAEQMLQIAQWAVIHEMQARYFKAEQNPPEKETVKVSDLIHDKPMILAKFTPAPPKVKVSKQLEDLLQQLSPEEIATLLA